MNAVRVAIVAGESSGDALGGALITALQAQMTARQAAGEGVGGTAANAATAAAATTGPAPPAAIEFRGVAGPAMRAAGCQALADAHELAVMGLIEPLAHLPRLLRLRARLLADLSAWQPQVFIGIDAPAFNLTLAGRLKARGVATVQYVSPQIWAWRQGRVRKIARRCDQVLCLLPFEPAFYARHAVHAQFVGHPLADQLPLVPDRAAARAALGLPAGTPVLALLPGSRLGEVQRLAAPFLASAAQLVRRHHGLQLVAPMANAAVRAEFERALAAAAPLTVRVLDGQARTALTAADAALVASGTASLEALLCRCPMVVAYRVSALTAALVRGLKLVRLTRFSLPNLLAGEALVPEFFQQAAIPANLCPALEQVLVDTGRREYLQRRFRTIHESLRAGGAGDGADGAGDGGAARAAQAVMQLIEARANGRGDIGCADSGSR